MSKSNYYKERVIQLLLFFAFMLPMGCLLYTSDAADE